MNPLVSIIIPTYNRADLISETLDSILAQTYTNWECIIVDDGSDDNTQEIIDNYMKTNSRFQYHQRLKIYPKGASSCRNYGFEKSRGNYVQWLDDDDLISNNKIEEQVKVLQSLNNNMIFTTCDWDLFWYGKKLEKRNLFNSNSPLSAGNFYQELFKQQTFVPVHSFLMSRELILLSGVWNVQLTLNDDAEFICRILANCDALVNTSNCLVLYRSYEGARISQLQDIQSLKSLLLSLSLMQAHLKHKEVFAPEYFRWRLKKILLKHSKLNMKMLSYHFYFFNENGINLNCSKYYLFRHFIYKQLYPTYKFFFKSKTSQTS